MGFKSFTRKVFKKQSKSRMEKRDTKEKKPLLLSLEENLTYIRQALGNSTDILSREIPLDDERKYRVGVVYTDGLVDIKAVNNFIVEPLVLTTKRIDKDQVNPLFLFNWVETQILTTSSLRQIETFEELFHDLLSGDTIVLIDGVNKALVSSLKGWEDRGVTEPSAQTVIRGPREGFSETLRTNTSLLRRKIKDPNMWLETFQVGTKTQTDVAIMYLQNIVNPKIVEEVRKRINQIEIDGILESGYIEELIQDQTFTPFPTVYNTERPDVIAANLLEGKVVIMVDGTPFALIVPALFNQFFQSAEDYYQRWDIGTLIRLLRYFSYLIALLAPSLYIAVTAYHQEMLPTPLLLSLAAQREGVPFPAFIEALMMEITFEILREAGIRMPRAVGQAVSIVGALVIGQAAVDAGIVSPAMVIVVSLTAIASFVSPAFDMSISARIIRFGLMILAASFGLFGVMAGLMLILIHLCSLRSFGIPYMAPFAPFMWEGQKDGVTRLPWWAMFSRPRLISQKNITRENNSPATASFRKENSK